ncbi:carbohydrate sulfotransferase 5-like [Pyxicephalus adspersus]|uniref:Sulfotransferase n=1 Tax=Pyxicephalus adspersus TaxID=30357 RepID=A0AAV2ZS58_PYXAD|nr:TPA: hypothetical protein GDO54_002499 [Pyxicephalus adspersus]
MGKLKRTFYVFAALINLYIILLLFTNLGIHVSKSNHKEKERNVNILIISTWRSGSSLVGQFFNQNPDVFYLKEPSWHVWKTMPHNSARGLQMAVRDLIRSIFKCNMSVLDAYLQNRSHVSNLFGWSSSRALCSPPVCNMFSHNNDITENNCRKNCNKSPFSMEQQSCNTYSHIVLQEFRIFDIKVLYSLLKDPTLNLKILHVVRDPRALAKSLKFLKFFLKFNDIIILKSHKKKISDKDREKVLREICQSQVDMYRTSNTHPPPFLNNRYMLLRYDDLVRHPWRTAKHIFDFAGLKLTNETKSWIYKMTHGEGLQHLQPFNITSRNALRVSLDWKNVLTLKEIRMVQKICKDFMDVFRYQNINSKNDLKDLNFETVLPRSKEDFQWQ